MSVKICGLVDESGVTAAVEAGADFVGFVFAPSVRRIDPVRAGRLAECVPASIQKVGLFVRAEKDEIAHVLSHVPLDVLQLHGGEDIDYVADVRAHFKLPIIKAFAIGTAEDLIVSEEFAGPADFFLFDTAGSNGTFGGGGVPFDWKILQTQRFSRPWFLAGGLTPDNVAQAIRETGAKHVDVSSGVEKEKGRKDSALIKRFVESSHKAMKDVIPPTKIQ